MHCALYVFYEANKDDYYRPGSPGSQDYILLFNVYDTITLSGDLIPRTKTCLKFEIVILYV